ncbi:MAG TPA: hypothetical protein VL360_08975 [Gammaproteobacteria bacterium]|nr:hypothetical protein [Gammaproteobacteria bacterium]
MLARYDQIKADISRSYQQSYRNDKSSLSLANCIYKLDIDDIILLLTTVRDNPELRQMSLQRSAKTKLFDKLIIMTSGEANPWVLRLHSYPLRLNGENDRIQDDEEHVHYHRWDLTSIFLTGGFINRQYQVSESDNFSGDVVRMFEFEMPPTIDCPAEKRNVVALGEKYIHEFESSIYMAGDQVHYPIAVPHNVECASVSPFTGITMTLALTGESLKWKSTFYEKQYQDAVPLVHFSEAELINAIDMAITRLQLKKLCSDLARMGHKRFSYLNSIETELLPTITMIQLQKSNFKERDGSHDVVRKKINTYLEFINNHALERLIQISQNGLYDRAFVADVLHLNSLSAQSLFSKRNNVKPVNVVSQNRNLLR